jgi:hypothetical protein
MGSNPILSFIFKMRKNTHPLKRPTVIILKNGSTILKKWNFFKKILKTDVDFLTHPQWKLKKN